MFFDIFAYMHSRSSHCIGGAKKGWRAMSFCRYTGFGFDCVVQSIRSTKKLPNDLPRRGFKHVDHPLVFIDRSKALVIA